MVQKLNATVLRNHLNLECIHDDLSYLSIEVPRKLKLIKELDIRLTDKRNKLSTLQKRFFEYDCKDAPLQKQIVDLFEEIEALGKEKVTIAKQCTAAVDRHLPVLKKQISNLDRYINKDDIPSPRNRNNAYGDYLSEGSSRRPARRHPRNSQTYGSLSPRTQASQMQGAGSSYDDYQLYGPSYSQRFDTSFMQPQIESLDDQAVKEECYCICKQPASFDENMIACDNKNCQIEWFHVKCVLGDQPMPADDERWECPICQQESMKNMA